MIHDVMQVSMIANSQGVIDTFSRWGQFMVRHIDAVSVHLQDWRLATLMAIVFNVAVFFTGVLLCRIVGNCVEWCSPLEDFKDEKHDNERDKRNNFLLVIFIGTTCIANIAMRRAFRLPLAAWKIAMISIMTNLACMVKCK